MANITDGYNFKDFEPIVGFYTYKSYVKLTLGNRLTIEDAKHNKPGVVNNIRKGFGSFLKDFGPTLIVKILRNIIITGSFFEALQRSLLQVGQESVMLPNDVISSQTQIFTLLSYTRAYLDVSYQQNINDMEEILAAQKNGTLDDRVKILGKKYMVQKIKGILDFINYLERVKSQIENNLIGKTQDQIIDSANNAKEKPVGLWAQIVNWVKNKIGKGNKTYSVKSQLDNFIKGLVAFYHISGISSILLQSIASSSIMNRYDQSPTPLNILDIQNNVEEIIQCFSSVPADTINSSDYISFKTTIDRLPSLINVYKSSLGDSIDTNFKVIEIRAIYALMINTLRDIVNKCMKISPDPIIYSI